MESLLNEAKLNFKRGQLIKWYNPIGKIKLGKYVMAGSTEGYIVVTDYDSFGGLPKVVPLSALVK